MSARSGGGPSYAPPASGGGSGVTSVNGNVGPAVTLVASDVGAQPVDSDLTAIALLATTAFGRSFLDRADASAARTLLGLGTAATTASSAYEVAGAAAAAQAAAIAASQPVDSDLTAIAALATTTFGRSFLILADPTAARALLGLGDIATQNRAALSLGRLNVLGHSWIAGSTVGNTGTPYMEMQGMLARAAGLLGTSNDNIMNMAQSGSSLTGPTNPSTGSGYGGWAAALQYLIPSNATMLNDPASPVITHGPCVPGAGLLVHGINDIIRNTASYPTQGRNAMKQALRTYLSISRAGALYKHKYLNSVFTWDTQLTFSGFAGTVTQTTGNTGAGVRTSAVNGDYVEYLIPADFRGGTIAMAFIGGKNLYAILNTTMNTLVTTLVLNLGAATEGTLIANGDVITCGTEDMLVTAGGGSGTLTVTRNVNGTVAATHTAGDPITISIATHKATWSTSGAGATSAIVSGATATQLSGQGYAGTRVAVVKRFGGLGADMAGKTIRATVAGYLASETYPIQFDAVWIEAELVSPQVILNVPRFAFGLGYTTVYAQAPSWNSDLTTIISEFDAYVKVCDLDSVIFNKNGALKTTIAAANTMVVTANTLASWDILLGDPISINGTSRVITAITGPVGSDYTITFSGAAISATAGIPVSRARWFHTDLIHWNGVGHGVVASLIYDTYAALPATLSYQLGNTSATWVQDQRSGLRLGVINGAYLQPAVGVYSTKLVALNSQYYYPIDITEECWVTGFGVSTSAAVATAAARVGIYDSDASGGRPGGIIAELGTIQCATSGVFTAPGTCYIRLRPGRYWTALKSDTAATTFRSAGITALPFQVFVTAPAVGAVMVTGYGEAGSAGAMVATASPSESITPTPLVWLQLGATEFA